ncbi:hypothetical protein BLNAU_12920 [Blattamonas nauphoetae]|uniref:Uncharacterized protein n=1 Tax=Blattamonas nauphoetae TaxID=2049346 RepID=A0ABQ9XK13_9EUKA|nr:hypothetical protein BLNAU_12920 [Blattamonas nauphoetae]
MDGRRQGICIASAQKREDTKRSTLQFEHLAVSCRGRDLLSPESPLCVVRREQEPTPLLYRFTCTRLAAWMLLLRNPTLSKRVPPTRHTLLLFSHREELPVLRV